METQCQRDNGRSSHPICADAHGFVTLTASIFIGLQFSNNETKALWKKSWVIYAKKLFGSPEKVLDHLGRYTHRVALSNERILSAYNEDVTFQLPGPKK
jgi:hypothetical protein